MCLTKKIPFSEHVNFRLDTQFFNVFNHPNFALPSNQAEFARLIWPTSLI
jgi:hypothetical protein